MNADAADRAKGITFDSDLSRQDRKFYIVTTAALPWRTGTSVNPLLRALYLSRGRPSKSVCLFIPWLEDKGDRDILYGGAFDDAYSDDEEQGKKNQKKWIRNFASKECGMPGVLLTCRFIFAHKTRLCLHA